MDRQEGKRTHKRRKDDEEDAEDQDLHEADQKKRTRRLKLEEWKKQTSDVVVEPSNTPTDAEEDPLDAYMRQICADIAATKAQDSSAAPKHGMDEEDMDDDEDEVEEVQTAEEYKQGRLERIESQHSSRVEHSNIKKNLYVQVPEIKGMTLDEVRKWRREHEGMKIMGTDCPYPVLQFTQIGLPDPILNILERRKFTSPTPIQSQAIPAAMSGRDIIGAAKTGSGKTLAYLLPLLRHINIQERVKKGEGPIGIILVPTRELAVQVHSEAKIFGAPLGIRVAMCVGGNALGDQISQLKHGAEVAVCTPGRIIELLCLNNGRVMNLFRTSFIVLDEADRMLDMGFESQILSVINNSHKDRQLLMFSATFPVKLEKIARQIMKDPIAIVAGGRNVVCSEVQQRVEILNEEKKLPRLFELLNEWKDKGNILVFADTQETVDYLFCLLTQSSFECVSLHGHQDQSDRLWSIQEFKKKRKTIMIATRIASRGLHVEDLNLVVNYSAPEHLEDYIHSVGRTGRAGKTGVAITFITPSEEDKAVDIVKALQNSHADVPEELEKMADNGNNKKEALKKINIAKDSSAVEKARQFALRLEEEHQKEGEEEGGEVDNIIREDDNGIVSAEIEINDYHQMARWKVTHKESLNRISEWCGATVTVKGEYCRPGRSPHNGGRKLYLLLEAPTVPSLESARDEVMGILQEQVASFYQQDHNSRKRPAYEL